ncbi:hypothetical protein T4B_12894 [Trichinella pseudospiralis]|uniref:Uncharacterized protein n=1 Tax=Trichinella pseudospiralis TaxID=6337 RepID=A0A0V1I531_TRIPS|nr:hypothetical protein T4B_12894 [Trichinella pseudospiralis]
MTVSLQANHVEIQISNSHLSLVGVGVDLIACINFGKYIRNFYLLIAVLNSLAELICIFIWTINMCIFQSQWHSKNGIQPTSCQSNLPILIFHKFYNNILCYIELSAFKETKNSIYNCDK